LGELLPAHVPLYLTYAGRIVAPIFFFLSVESYFKTSNRRRYIIRLFAWALAMQVGNLIISEIVKNAYHAEGSLGQNIFLSIAIGISMIAAFEWGRKQSGIKKWGGFVFAGILAFFSLLTESSYNGLAMFIVFYFFYNKKPALYNIEYFWEFEYQWMMIAALPFIILYNGERGPHSLKYLFYAFYPLHIWALYIIRYSILAFYYPIQ